MSNVRKSLIALALPALLVSMAAVAQKAPAPQAAQTPQPINLADAQQKALERAAEMDTNRDGRIEAAEVLAMRERMRLERAERRLAQLDANGDGVVTTDEFVAARQARLAALDTDGDGVVSVEERREARGKRGGHGRHHFGRGPGFPPGGAR